MQAKSLPNQPKKWLIFGQNCNIKGQHYSLWRRFVIGICAIACLFFSIMTWRVQQSHIALIEQKFLNIHYLIGLSLRHTFSYTEGKMALMGDLISDKGHVVDDEMILTLFRSFARDQKISHNLSWSTIGWANAQHLVTLDSQLNKLAEPIDLTRRDYMPLTRELPNQLHLGRPNIGSVSKRWILPAGMGVIDKNGHYLGAMIIGFDIASLTKHLELLLKDKTIHYALLEKDTLQIISQSKEQTLSSNNELFRQLVAQSELLTTNRPFTHIAWMGLGQSYMVSVLPNSSFILLVNLNESLSWPQFIQASSGHLFSLTLIAIVILLGLSALYRMVIAPFRQLAHEAEHISSNHIVPISDQHSIEAHLLAEALRTLVGMIEQERYMRNELQISQTKLQELNNHLEERVQQRTEQLTEALNVKHRFLNNISHEMKVPLHGICFYTDLLLSDWHTQSTEQQYEIVQEIEQNAQRLHQLIMQTLDLAKAEQSGVLILTKAPCKMETIIHSSVRSIDALIQNKPLFITYDLPTNTELTADSERLGQVWTNLLHNAVRYSAEGTISILVTEQTMTIPQGPVPALYCQISDEGIGVPANELKLIFESFTESSRSASQKGGTGLGLALCRHILRAHHGRIWAENRTDGKSGLTVCFVIPR
jgi:signal transduction histidine kinase